jgi:hypothetical protein
MVDFRYHLVSIVAVFLALAVGIVVGTTALNGQLLDRLKQSNSDLIGDKRGLEGDVRGLRDRLAAEEQAAALLGPSIVGSRLQGERVVIVSTPDAPASLREQLLPLLAQAGATLGAQVRLRPGLLAPDSATLLDGLVAQAAVPGQPLPEGEPVDQAMTQLSQVLVRQAGVAAPAAATVQRVLAAYEGEDLIDVEGTADTPGSMALLLTAGTPTSVDPGLATAQSRALLVLARQLDARSRGAVVAGPLDATEDSGLLRVLRDDTGLSDRLGSVDGADTPTGRNAVVLALAEQVRGGSGSYGTGPRADSPVPEPASP